jgi:hypothetical protein
MNMVGGIQLPIALSVLIPKENFAGNGRHDLPDLKEATSATWLRIIYKVLACPGIVELRTAPRHR